MRIDAQPLKLSEDLSRASSSDACPAVAPRSLAGQVEQVKNMPLLEPAMARVSRWFMSHALAPPHGMPMPGNKKAPDAFPVRYGVEIEMVGMPLAAVARQVARILGGTLRDCPSASRSPFQDPSQAVDVLDKQGRIWEVKPDADAVEIASPILANAIDLNMVQRIARSLQERAVCDAAVGLHIHIEGKNFTPANLSQLMALLARHESVLYKALKVHPQRRDVYCQALRTHAVREVIAARPSDMHAWQHIYHAKNQNRRFMGVNLENLRPACRGTIEFRYFNATLDASEIGCHVGLVMALARRALGTTVFPKAAQAAAPPSLPHLLMDLRLDPDHPVSRRLCRQWQERVLGGLDKPIREALEPLLVAEGFAGDISFLIAHGISVDDVVAATGALTPAARRVLFADAVAVFKWAADADYQRLAYRTLAQLAPRCRQTFMRAAEDMLRKAAQEGLAAPMLQRLQRMPVEEIAAWAAEVGHLGPDILVTLAPRKTIWVAQLLPRLGLHDSDCYTPALFRSVAAARTGQVEVLQKVAGQLFTRRDETPEARVRLVGRLAQLSAPHIVAVGSALARVLHLTRYDHELDRLSEVLCTTPMARLFGVVKDLAVFYEGSLFDQRFCEVARLLAVVPKPHIARIRAEGASLLRANGGNMRRSDLWEDLLRAHQKPVEPQGDAPQYR